MNYTTNQVAREIGERPGRLQYWLRTGIVKLEKRQRIKQGKPIEFSERDLNILKTMMAIKAKNKLTARRSYLIAKSMFDINTKV